MTPDQKAILTNVVRDETTTIQTIEYPACAAGRFDCLKLVYTVEINGVPRTFVDWYENEDAVVVQTREIVPAIVDSHHPSRGEYLDEPGLVPKATDSPFMDWYCGS